MSRALKSLGVLFAFLAIVTLSRHVISTNPSATTTTVAPGGSTTTTVPVTGASCSARDFSGVYDQGQGAAGTIYARVTLTKTSGGACTLKGWPMLTLLDRTGAVLTSSTNDLPTSNSPLSFPDARANHAPSTVALHQGSTTTFSLAYSDVPRGTEVCAAATTVAVQLVHGGPVVDVTPQYAVSPCDSGSVWVSPLY